MFDRLDMFLNGTTATVNNVSDCILVCTRTYTFICVQEVTEYVAQLTGYVDRFVNYTVDQVSALQCSQSLYIMPLSPSLTAHQ